MTQIEDRIDIPERKRPPRWMMLSAAAVLAIVAGVVAVLLLANDDGAPVVTEPTPPTIGVEGSFDGYWESESQRLVIDNDTYWVIENGGLVDTGQFRSGASVFFTSSADSPFCAESMEFIGAAHWDEDGQSFSVRLVSTDCAYGLAFGDRFTRTDPFEIPDKPPAPTAAAATDPNNLIGVWLVGTRSTIEFLDEDSYVITRDGAVFDQGAYETSPGGSDEMLTGAALVLRSDEDSPSCESGDERSSTFEIYDRLTLQLHEDDCAARLDAMLPFMDLRPQG